MPDRDREEGEEPGEPGRLILRPDGSWFSVGRDELDITTGFGAALARGTWTYASNVITINIPDFGYTRSFNVVSTAAEFRTRGVPLNPAAREELERNLDEYEAMFPGSGLRQEIEALGGIDAILSDIDLDWSRVA